MATKLQQTKITLQTNDNFASSSEAALTPPAGLTTVKASEMVPLGSPRQVGGGAAPTLFAQDWLLTILWSD